MLAPIKIAWAVSDEYLISDKATLREPDRENWVRLDLAPGTARWSCDRDDRIVGLDFICPCGCGSIGALMIVSGFGPKDLWRLTNGDYENPTLEPSVQKTSPCRWHGFLERGYWCLNRADVLNAS